MKKALSFLVAVVMVLAVFPASALAESVEYYDLWVSGVRVDSSNKDDVLKDGAVSFDPESNTLTLSGAVIDNYCEECYNKSSKSYKEAIFYSGTDALTIELEGKNVISASDLEYGIDCEYADLTICGKGYLEATAEYSCIYLEDGSLTLTDCVLKLESDDDECICLESDLVADNVIMKIKVTDEDAIMAGSVTMNDCILDLDAAEYGIWASYDLCLENCRGAVSGAEDAAIEASEGDVVIRNCKLDVTSDEGNGIGSCYSDVDIEDSRIKIASLRRAIYANNLRVSGGEVVAIISEEDDEAVYVSENGVVLEDDAVLEMYCPNGATNREPKLYKGAVVDYGDRKDLARMNVRQMNLGEDWYEYDYVRIHPEEEGDPVTITIPVNTAAEEEEENPDTGAPVLF